MPVRASLISFFFVLVILPFSVFGSGDGNLLKRSAEETCHACHKTDKNAKTDADSIKSHNAEWLGRCSNTTYKNRTDCLLSSGTWTSKWGQGGWGIPGGQYGEIVCTTCHTAHDTTNIYLIRETITTPNGSDFQGRGTSSVPVNFRKRTGAEGEPMINGNMGDDSSTRGSSTRICEVCHTYDSTQTNGVNKHAYAMSITMAHKNGQDCVSCHNHKKAFTGGGCDGCHGNPPSDGTIGPPGVATPASGVTSPASAGAHVLHAATRAMLCEACHTGGMPASAIPSNTIDMGFTLNATNVPNFNGSITTGTLNSRAPAAPYTGFNAAAWTTVNITASDPACSVYCHGSTMEPNGGSNTTPSWTGGSSQAACGTCHGATADNPPLLGSHFKHSAEYFDQLNWGYNYSCSLCHKDPSVDRSLHVNNKSEVVFSTDPKTAGGIYTGTDTMLDAYGTCNNVYCHSTAQTSPPGGAPTYRETPVWGTTFSMGMDCDGCHYYNDSTPQLATGSHQKHFEYLYWGLGPGAECVTCHNYKQADESYSCGCCHEIPGIPYVWSPAADWGHVDHAVEVRFGPLYGGPTLRGNYSGTPEPNDAYGHCSNIYCHSNGTGGTSQTGETRGIADNSTPDWGSGPIPCSACHGNPPNYPTGSPKANSHAEHAAANITCDKCHYNTTRDNSTIYSKSAHVNRRYDVTRNTTVPGLTFTYTYYATGGRCSSVSCHTGAAACAGYTTSYWGIVYCH